MGISSRDELTCPWTRVRCHPARPPGPAGATGGVPHVGGVLYETPRRTLKVTLLYLIWYNLSFVEILHSHPGIKRVKV